ncbi:unnamed protein product [Arctogadus glacialis]
MFTIILTNLHSGYQGGFCYVVRIPNAIDHNADALHSTAPLAHGLSENRGRWRRGIEDVSWPSPQTSIPRHLEGFHHTMTAVVVAVFRQGILGHLGEWSSGV